MDARPEGYPMKGYLFEILGYLTSCPEKVDSFTDTTKDLFTIYSKSVKQACIRPKCWLSMGQTFDILDDIVKQNMHFVVIEIPEKGFPSTRHDITHRMIQRLVAMYKWSDMQFESVLTGEVVSIKGQWRHMEQAINSESPWSAFERGDGHGLSFSFKMSADQRPRNSSEVSLF